jgi:hypothetical protein
MNDTTYTDTLRDGADELCSDLEELADALDDGTATGDDVREAYLRVAETMVELEDAGTAAGAIDDSSSRQRAVDEARKAIHQLYVDGVGNALPSLVAAAEYAEEAYRHD